MKPYTITRFKADDGETFADEAACLRHEYLTKTIALLSKDIQPLGVWDSDFANGTGFIQHERGTFNGFIHALTTLAHDSLSRDEQLKFGDLLKSFREHPSEADRINACRIIHTCCPMAIKYGYSRIYNINLTTYKEYGSPFYASLPQASKGDVILWIRNKS